MSDIVVGMSPSGVNEVIAALHKIQQESGKTAKAGAETASSMGKIGSAISGLRTAMGALGAGYLVSQFKQVVGAAIDTADAIGDLAAASGASAKDISVIGVAAREAGTDFGTVEKAIRSFAMAQESAKSGNAETVAAFKALGINAKDLASMNMGQIFGKVAAGMSEVGGSSEKIKIAQQLFGKAGMDMIDICDRVGAEGFEKLTQRAERAGLLMSDDTAAAAGSIKQTMGQMKTQMEGLGMQFVQGLAPAMADGMSAISGTMQDGKTVFQKFGEFCGGVFKAVIAGLMTIAAAAAKVWAVLASAPGFIQGAGNKIAGSARALRSGLLSVGSWITPDSWGLGDAARAEMDQAQADWSNAHSQWSSAADDMNNKFENIKNNYRDFMEKLKYGDPNAAGAPTISGKNKVDLSGAGGGGKNSADAQREAKAAADAKRAFLLANLEAQNRIIEANNAIQLQHLKEQLGEDLDATTASYDDKLAITKDYYARVRKITEDNAQNELLLLQARIDELEAMKGGTPAEEAKRQTELLKLTSEFQARSIGLQKELNGLDWEEYAALKQVNKEREDSLRMVAETQYDLAQRTAEMQGQTIEAQRMALAKELADLREKLRLTEEIGSEAWESANATFEAYEKARNAEISYQEQRLALTQALNGMEEARQAIQTDMEAGRLSHYQGEAKILEMEKSRLPVLEQLVALLRAAAAATGNQTMIQEANQLDAQVQAIKGALEVAGTSFQVFKSKALDAIGDQLTSFFSSGINSAKSFGDAMRSMALGVVQALQSIVAQMLINLMMQKLLGGIFGAIGGAAGGATSVFGGSPSVALATGGYVRGPGTSTSDSIPALLSNGEFVVRASSVRQPGVLDALRQLNRGASLSVVQPTFRRGYAEGGLVSPLTSNLSDNSSLTVSLDEGLLLKTLQTPAGKRVLVKMLADQKRTVRGVLG